MELQIRNLLQFSYDKQPLAIFLLGTNGSGKSTLRHYLDLSEISINIDPDLLNKAYSNKYPTNYQIEASKEAILQYDNAIKKGLNVCIESTLSGYGIIKRIKEAKLYGFYNIAYYIQLDNVELHLARIKQRVKEGGHDIADDLVRKRYINSQQNLINIKNYFDELFIINNSEYFKLITKIHRGTK